MKATQFRRLLWRLINRLWPTLAARLKVALLGTNRLGIQFQTEHQAVIDYVTLVQPPVWKSINVVNPEFLARVTAANPKALGIYRAHPNSYWANDPEERAVEHVGRIAAEIRYISHHFHIIEDNNEYVFPFNSPKRIEAADRYMAKFVELCFTVLGKKALVLNAATGNWGDDIGQFVCTLDALRCLGGYIGFHEYDFPTMWRTHEEDIARGGEGMWHCLRWKRAARTIKQLYDGWCPKFIISEAGIDSGAKPGEIPQRGFRGVHPDNLDASVENYVSSLRWYYDRVDDDVFAVTLFGCGMTAPWDGPEGFDIKDTAVPYRVSLFPTEEPPPNGGDGMEIKVYDRDYNERTVQWARDLYGFDFERAEVEEGQSAWRLITLREKTGVHCHNTRVLDKDGNPVDQQRVAWYWPDAPPFPFPTEYDWHDNFEVGLTNANGDVCPGMGRGAYHDPGTCGPHEAWIHDPDVPSDVKLCAGMLGGTFHDHLDCEFQLMVGTGDGPGNDCGWTMAVQKEEKGGARLIIGRGLPVGTPVTVSFHSWSITVLAGSKAEYGPGAFLVDIWNPGMHKISVLGCEFDVEVKDNEIAWLTFVEGEPPEPEARVLTDWMSKSDAEELLGKLENDGYMEFSLENRP